MNPETTTGGVALKFYSSVRLEIRHGGQIKEGGAETQVIGARTKVNVVKNKFAPPFKTVEFPIIFGEGISQLDIILDMAATHEIVKKSGSWFSYGELRLAQGAGKTKQYLRENPELLAEIEAKLREKINPSDFNFTAEDHASTPNEDV
jgi:recombination protein RecA